MYYIIRDYIITMICKGHTNYRQFTYLVYSRTEPHPPNYIELLHTREHAPSIRFTGNSLMYKIYSL